jgi:hypothetical protein
MFAVAAKDFVDSEFPREHRVKIPGALETAYAAVDALYRNEPLFSVTSAQYGKGHVVAWGVDLQIERLITSGLLPYDYRWVPFEKPTGRFLQMRLPASPLSVSQLQHKKALPRPAEFRHNRILNNQFWLDLPEFEDEKRISGLPHLILSHGYQSLSFAQVGLLNRLGRRLVWTYRT